MHHPLKSYGCIIALLVSKMLYPTHSPRPYQPVATTTTLFARDGDFFKMLFKCSRIATCNNRVGPFSRLHPITRDTIGLFLFQPTKFHMIRTLPMPKTVTAIATLSDNFIAVAQSERIDIYRIDTQQTVYSYHGHKFDITALSKQPESTVLMSSDEFYIQLWDTTTGQRIHNLYKPSFCKTTLITNYNNEPTTLIAQRGEDACLLLSNTQSGKVLKTIPTKTNGCVIAQLKKNTIVSRRFDYIKNDSGIGYTLINYLDIINLKKGVYKESIPVCTDPFFISAIIPLSKEHIMFAYQNEHNQKNYLGICNIKKKRVSWCREISTSITTFALSPHKQSFFAISGNDKFIYQFAKNFNIASP